MIYLDNAATSYPKPAAVLDAVTQAITVYGGNPGRGGCPPSSLAAEQVFSCREKVNEYFNGYGAEYTVFTSNATSALNAAIFGTAKKLGYKGHFVITAFEHNSVLRPVEELKRSHGMDYTVVKPCLRDDGVTASRVLSALRPDTAAVIMTHASNVCGRILPIARVGRELKKRGVAFIVDGSQTAGKVATDMKRDCIDIYCTAGHKGLLGPAGTGLMLLSPDLLPEPILFGGTGSNSDEATQPAHPPERYESGTLNTVGIMGLSAGIDLLRNDKNTVKRELDLAQRLHRGLKEIRGVRLYTDFDREKYVPTVFFNVGDGDSFTVAEALCDMGFATRGGLHCAPLAHRYFGTLDRGGVRVSLGLYNTAEQIDSFLTATETISKKILRKM